MKHLLTLCVLVVFGQGLLGQTYYGPNYLHLNHASNCVGDYTVLDGSIVGTNFGDNLLFTHVWENDDTTHQGHMKKSHGLYYIGTDWSIFNETTALIDTTLAFNVLNPKNNGTSFVHTVTVANSSFNESVIDNPLLNNNPSAVFFINKTWNTGIYDTAHVGIWYDFGFLKWSIYNEDPAGFLEINSTYNIFIPDATTSFYKHIAHSGFYSTILDNPLLNGNPDAKIFMVHDFTNDAITQGYINDEIGVWYDGNNWEIFNENQADTLFTGATFNILIVKNFPVGIANNNKDSGNIKVTPNPAKDRIAVLMNSDYLKTLQEIRLTSMDGKTVLQKNYQGHAGEEIVLDLSAVSAGLYMLTAVAGEGTLSTKVNIVR